MADLDVGSIGVQYLHRGVRLLGEVLIDRGQLLGAKELVKKVKSAALFVPAGHRNASTKDVVALAKALTTVLNHLHGNNPDLYPGYLTVVQSCHDEEVYSYMDREVGTLCAKLAHVFGHDEVGLLERVYNTLQSPAPKEAPPTPSFHGLVPGSRKNVLHIAVELGGKVGLSCGSSRLKSATFAEAVYGDHELCLSCAKRNVLNARGQSVSYEPVHGRILVTPGIAEDYGFEDMFFEHRPKSTGVVLSSLKDMRKTTSGALSYGSDGSVSLVSGGGSKSSGSHASRVHNGGGSARGEAASSPAHAPHRSSSRASIGSHASRGGRDVLTFSSGGGGGSAGAADGETRGSGGGGAFRTVVSPQPRRPESAQSGRSSQSGRRSRHEVVETMVDSEESDGAGDGDDDVEEEEEEAVTLEEVTLSYWQNPGSRTVHVSNGTWVCQSARGKAYSYARPAGTLCGHCKNKFGSSV
jgi:hypothetical protein